MVKLSYDRNAKSGQYVSIGRASDGVVILKPAAKPKRLLMGCGEVQVASSAPAGAASQQK
jgi:hypothetical protein